MSTESAAARTRWDAVEVPLNHKAVAETRQVGKAALVDLATGDGKSIATLEADTRGDVVQFRLSPGDIQRGVDASREGAPAAAVTRDPPLLKALERDDPKGMLDALRDPGGGKLAETIHETRAKAESSGFEALKDGDVGRADRLFDVAQGGAADAPRVRVGRALADLETGLLARARGGAGRAFIISDADQIPLGARLRADGFSDDDIVAMINGDTVRHDAAAYSLVRDGASLKPLMRVERATHGTVIDRAGRESLVAGMSDSKPPSAVFYLDDRFHLNTHDLEVQGEGFLGDLAHDPDVVWERVDVPLEKANPELMVMNEVRYRRVLRADRGLSGARPVIRIRRCDDEDRRRHTCP